MISHRFTSKPKKRKIKVLNDEFYFKQSGEKVKIKAYSGDSLLLRIDKEPNSLAILYPFKSDGSKIQLEDFGNTSWTLTSTHENLNNITYHFLDSGDVSIVTKNKTYGSTNNGEWKIFNSDSYYCLLLRDLRSMEENVFYLKKRKINELSMLIGYQPFLDHPKQIDVKLKLIDKPKESDLIEIKNNIVGKWDFKSFTNKTDTVVFDSLFRINFFIEFNKDLTYNLVNQLKYSRFGSTEVINYSQDEHGKWELSDSGDFLIITPSDSWKRNLTIYSLNPNMVMFDLSMHIDEHGTLSTRVKMIKYKRP